MPDDITGSSAAQNSPRRDQVVVDRPTDIDSGAAPQNPPVGKDAPANQEISTDSTPKPTVPATPSQQGPAKQIAPLPPTRQPLYPGHQPQPHPAPGLPPPPHQNGQPPPQPGYPTGQVSLPPPPSPSYVAYNQPPLLMDRCPRCAYTPSLQYGQPPPPPPPYGSYLPANFYSAPPNMWQQPPPPHVRPQQPYANPPPPSLAQQRPAPAPTFQVPPEFRPTRYWPRPDRPLPPAHIQEHVSSLNEQVSSLREENPPDYLPVDDKGYVLIPFIGPPKYAPVPTAEAIAALAPKWPKPNPGRADPNDGESRRDRQKRLGNQRMTRDQRRDVLLMRRLGYQFESIAKFLGATISSCHYTCRRGTPETNHKNGGRRVHFPPEVVTRMVEYVKDYQAKEKMAGKDKKTGKRKMPMLNWTLIRENCLADASGQIPKELKFTDDAMKKLLNKHGLFLRKPMSEEMREIGRLRGKKQWLDKLTKDRAEAARKAAAARAPGQSVGAAALAGGTMSPDGAGLVMDDGGNSGVDDAEMEDEVYSETDDTDIHSDDNDEDDGGDDGSHEEPMQIEDQLRQAIAAPGMYG